MKPCNPSPCIQVLSDLHLEVGQQYATFTFPATAPLLLLAGDTGRLIDHEAYLHFLQSQVSRYKKVLLVLGNHEFYGLNYESGLEAAQRLSEEPSLADRLVLLHRARWDDPDSALTILGCTLWSFVPESAYTAVQAKVGDYKKITGWTTEQHNQAHADDLAWLRGEVASIRPQGDVSNTDNKRQLLVATHHAPCLEGTSRPEHSNNPWSPAFATDLLKDCDMWLGVKTWVYGHIHYSTDFICKDIRVLANQRGYVFPESTISDSNSTTPREGESRGVRRIEKAAHTFDSSMAISV